MDDLRLVTIVALRDSLSKVYGEKMGETWWGDVDISKVH
jgi:hypothetical protein